MKNIISIFFLGILTLPIQLQAQQQEVIAENGEGIYRLLTRNGLSVTEYLSPFIELNKNQLGQNNTLIAGVKYKLPESTTLESSTTTGTGVFRSYEIFGSKYENVEITSSELEGACYYLISGHGGPDPGGKGTYSGHTLWEDEYAYDVTLRLARSLIQYGATVYLITRDPNDGIRDESFLRYDTDELCYPNLTIPLNPTKRLQQRSDAVNKLYAQNKGSFQRMIAIHVDSRSIGENIDVFFYHDKRSTTGQKAATILMNTLQDKYNEHQPGRGYKGSVSSRGLYVLRNTYPTAVFIELGNINHARDQQRLIMPDNRQALANWLTDGLIKDFNTNK